MAAKMMHQTRVTLLLSLNAVVILIVGVMIFSAINLNGGIELKVVSERSDELSGSLDEVGLLAPVSEEAEAQIPPQGASASSGGTGGGSYVTGSSTASSGGISQSSVPAGQLWAEDAITIYQTTDFDICVGAGLSGLGEMYWQTSDTNVIAGFYNTARTWLGFSAETCRYPLINGTGTTTITAGTYDGQRHDKLTVTVIAPPIEQWKKDVLALVNEERAKAGLAGLAWGSTCEGAANLRATEIKTSYSHTRPDGSSWSTTCPIPATGGQSGENLAAGNAAVSPATVVTQWMNSPEHRANILSAEFTHVAIGFEFDPGAEHRTYWSQYFSTY